MNLKELQRRLQEMVDEVKPLAMKSRDEELTDEEDTRFNELVESINEVQQDISSVRARQERADKMLGTVEELGQSTGRVSGIVPGSTPDEAMGQVRNAARRPGGSLGRRFTDDDVFKTYSALTRGNSGRFAMGSSFWAEDAPDGAYQRQDGPMDYRDLVSSGSFTDYIQPQRLPGIVAGDPFPLRVRDVLQNGRTDSNTIEYIRKNATTNNAAEVAEASTVAGATAKPESAIDLEVVSTSVKTIAHYIPVTRQMLQDAAQIRTFIDGELLYGQRQREDQQLISGDGTGANLTGIANTTGVVALDSTYWTASPLPGDSNELDALRRANRIIRVTGESNPSLVFAHPADVEVWDTLKDSNGNYLLRAGGPETNGIRRVWGNVIVETTAVTARNPIVGDGRRAVVFDRMDGQIFITDSHSDWFTKNLFAILAESRLALAVLMPAAFVTVDLDAA